jgi:uncharacterized glyoxalase superfamily protein PhnB
MTDTTTSTTYVWPTMTFRDAPAALRFLEQAFGFRRTAWYTREGDPSIVEHAEMRWPAGGGIMFGTAGKDDSPFSKRAPGSASVYLVTDDPDGLYARAKAAGAEVIRELNDTDYGSRDFAVRDPEGNIWSFGTYAGA